MRRFVLGAVLLTGIAVAQVVLAPLVEVYHVKPDFFLISVVLAGMRMGSGSGLIWGLFAGMTQDALSGGIIGFNFLCKPVTGFVVGLLRNKLDFENPNTQSVVTLTASLGEGAALAVLLSAYHPGSEAMWSISQIVIPLSLYNALIMPFVTLTERTGAVVMAELRRRESRLAE